MEWKIPLRFRKILDGKVKLKQISIAFIHIIVSYHIVMKADDIGYLGYEICHQEPFDTILAYIIYMITSVPSILLFTKIVTRRPLSEFGLKRPFLKKHWCATAFILPLSVFAYYLLFTDGTLIQTETQTSQILLLITSSLFLGLSSGMVEEILFRGIIMKNTEWLLSKKAAILLPSLAFAFVHISQVDRSDRLSVGLLMLGGTLVGIMFSAIVYESGSIWPSAFVHGVWNMFVNLLTVTPVTNPPPSSLYYYLLNDKNVLITGGAFGLETSATAIAGYLVVTLLVFYLNRRNTFIRHV